MNNLCRSVTLASLSWDHQALHTVLLLICRRGYNCTPYQGSTIVNINYQNYNNNEQMSYFILKVISSLYTESYPKCLLLFTNNTNILRISFHFTSHYLENNIKDCSISFMCHVRETTHIKNFIKHFFLVLHLQSKLG